MFDVPQCVDGIELDGDTSDQLKRHREPSDAEEWPTDAAEDTSQRMDKVQLLVCLHSVSDLQCV